MRGIILAGGRASRLRPATISISKQLLPVFDKPMVYYPLSTLVTAGMQEILIVTGELDSEQFKRLLGDGSQWGIRIEYLVQASPDGIAHALMLAEDFLDGGSVALILGDNLFHGAAVENHIRRHVEPAGACITARQVSTPEAYGVLEINAAGDVTSIQEKPARPGPAYAVPGLYLYDSDAVAIARTLRPSSRGELEITDVNMEYLRRDRLSVTVLDRDTAWIDTGTFETLAQASEYVQIVESRHGIKIGCVEEAAWRAGRIGDSQLRDLAKPLLGSGYGEYLLALLDGLAPGRHGDKHFASPYSH